MKKKMTILLSVFFLCLCTVMPAFATEMDGTADESCRVVDRAELLSDEEAETLIQKLDEISVRQKLDVTIMTTGDLEGYSVQDYADDMYKYYEFGYGSGKDGLMLLISMEDRDCCITTCGYAITVFTDAGIRYVEDQIVSDLSDGDYAVAFSEYADLCDAFITQARNGEPYDSDSLPQAPLSLLWIPVAIVIGFVLAIVIVGQMKRKLKTVRFQTGATDYVKPGSLHIDESRDLFLYHTVTRVPIPKESSSSSGSSTHMSSSGTIHGGGSRKF